MSTSNHPENSGADSLEPLKDMLRVVGKLPRSSDSWDFPYVSSALKKYVHGESAIVVTKFSAGFKAGDYHLLLHRVPWGQKPPTSREGRAGHLHARYGDIGSETDRVLGVRQLGDFPEKVFSAGKAWSSFVWLLPYDLINDDLGQSGVRFELSFVDNTLDAIQTISPRIVSVESDAAVGLGRSKQRLIEGMLDVQKSIPQRPSNPHRKSFDQLDLEDILSGFRIELSDLSDCAILRVSCESLSDSIKARLCPVDVLLRGLETGHD